MQYVNYKSKVVIDGGKLTFNAVNTIEVTTSLSVVGSMASVTLPRYFSSKNRTKVTEVLKRGQSIELQLCINDVWTTEFAGFIDKVGSGTPTVITCDGEWFLIKKAKLRFVLPKTTLKNLWQKSLPGYAIECPSLELGEYTCNNVSAYDVAKQLLQVWGLYTRIDTEKKKLTCFFPYKVGDVTKHQYCFGAGWNTDGSVVKTKILPNIKRNDLVWELAENRPISITAIANTFSGKKITTTVGSTDLAAEKRTLNYGPDVKTEADLKTRAKADIARMTFTGYSGKLTAFGWPRAQAGDACIITDPLNADREGTYLISDMKLSYSVDRLQYQRELTISYKL